MKKFMLLTIAILVALLSGCATVPLAPPEKDTLAKTFSTPSDKASLFIYRNESMGAAIPMAVTLNGKALGQTAAMTYFHLYISPGNYTINSYAEDVSVLGLDMEAGKNYFVWQEVKMGMWTARSKLQQVDEIIGRAGVKESKLITSLLSDADFGVSAGNTTEQKKADSAPSPSKKLRDLQNLKKEGVITEDEFEKKKNQLLKEL